MAGPLFNICSVGNKAGKILFPGVVDAFFDLQHASGFKQTTRLKAMITKFRGDRPGNLAARATDNQVLNCRS